MLAGDKQDSHLHVMLLSCRPRLVVSSSSSPRISPTAADRQTGSFSMGGGIMSTDRNCLFHPEGQSAVWCQVLGKFQLPVLPGYTE